MTVEQCADRLGVQPRMVRLMINGGKLEAVKVGGKGKRGTWLIALAEVERIEAERAVQRGAGKRGRPPKGDQ